MMINKRLINLCNNSKKDIGFTVLANWISVLCNIGIVFLIGGFINNVYLGNTLNFSNSSIIESFKYFNITSDISLLNGSIMVSVLIIIRCICNSLYKNNFKR